ncbi:hypothetical protein Aperf_G00000124429 [Anoplocephala perfoliata]
MPISYVDDISDGSGAFIFVKLLKRWKGSLYKLVWVDLSLYLAVYYVLNLTYRFALSEPQKRTFEDVVRYCEKMKGNIPVSFLLGFFVSGVIGRWYKMYMYIPWMNASAYSTLSMINCGDTTVTKEIRLSLMRYMNLAWILLMRRISDQIADRFKQLEEDSDDEHDGPSGLCTCCSTACKRKKKRKHAEQHPWSISHFERHHHGTGKTPKTPFDGAPGISNRQLSFFRLTVLEDESPNPGVTPRSEQVFDAFNPFEGDDEWSIRATLSGFNKDKKIRETFGKIITAPEIRAFEAIAKNCFKQTRQRYLPEYWVPIQWAARLVQKAGLHGHIPDARMISTMLQEIGDFRNKLQNLEVYSSIMMPLVYTQVVIIAVYSYFACELLASQFLEVPKVEGEGVVDFYVPIFSIFYFLFLMGWLKVALCVMNPFGDDDEDFETSAILDYNLDVSYRSVLMDLSIYPEKLQAATFEMNAMKGVENDNLKEFLKKTQNEMQKIDNTLDDNDLTNLEIKHRHCKCFHRINPSKKDNEENGRQQLIKSSNNINSGSKPMDV